MNVESPLKGWPRTRPLKSQTGFSVRARHLTPRRAKFTDGICVLINLSGIALIYLFMIHMRDGDGPKFFIVIAATIGFCVVMSKSRHFWGRLLFGTTTTIKFTPEQISIKGLMRFRNYDRTLPHEFNFEIHENAEREQEQEFEKRKKLKKLFRQSFHIILRYAGQRVEVADVYGKKEAEALLVRLQLLDQLMNAARGEHGAPVLSEPDVQYGERPEAG